MVKVIVGLGNPGLEYAKTRHNVGWMVLDHLADVWHFGGWRKDGVSLVAVGRAGDHPVKLVKPQTFMNLSGAALRPFARREEWSPARDLLVIVDEAALALGRYRLRARGSAGGHNGLRDIERELGSQEYARLRIGIRPADERRGIGDLADFVLSPFGRDERAAVDELRPRLTDAIEIWLRDGIERAMSLHNANLT
jgi:PTH1 family peptidyl-tRNA hydrolase